MAVNFLPHFDMQGRKIFSISNNEFNKSPVSLTKEDKMLQQEQNNQPGSEGNLLFDA